MTKKELKEIGQNLGRSEMFDRDVFVAYRKGLKVAFLASGMDTDDVDTILDAFDSKWRSIVQRELQSKAMKDAGKVLEQLHRHKDGTSKPPFKTEKEELAFMSGAVSGYEPFSVQAGKYGTLDFFIKKLYKDKL